jgi:phosphate transport system substrate-binding protein
MSDTNEERTFMSLARTSLSALAIAAISATGVTAQSRDNVQVAGSSTVLPYATIVAEAFGENFEFPTPVVESGGSSTGLRRFCEGVGENTIDIANSSRSIRDNEIASCAENGVTDIIEVRFGYDGIVFASDIDGPSFSFTPVDWYYALAANVVVEGELVPNPRTNWTEVRSGLPDQPIAAFIPGTRHGTREVFDERVILQGCEDSGALALMLATMGMDEDAAEEACMEIRADGVSVDIDGDYTETLARINADANGIGVFGLAFYENNTSVLQVATMNNVVPTVDAIASGEYPVSRPLFFYIKAAHLGVIPGLQEYADFFVSEDIAGDWGPLAAYGLVSDPELAETQAIVANGTLMGN